MKSYISVKQAVQRLNDSISVENVFKPIRRGKPTRLLSAGIEDKTRPNSAGDER